MLRFNDDAGPAGSVSSYSPAPLFSGSANDAPAPSRRGRVRSTDFGMPERQGLLDLARTYLEVQARLWPDLVGTDALPAADPATIAAMADESYCQELCLEVLDQAAFCRTPSVKTFPSRTRTIW